MITNRIENIQRVLKQKEEPTAFIVTSECNRRYMTGIETSSGYVIITPENKYFFTDSRYIEFAKNSCGDIYTVELFPKEEAKKYYSDLLRKENIKNIMYEENYILLRSKKHFDTLFEGYTLSESGMAIEKMRRIKDADEIENITKAQIITDKAFEHILKVISQNLNTVTEVDIAAELEYFMRKNGADGIAFDTIAVSGKKSSYPHGEPGNIKLSKGFLTMDFGATYNGYCADMTRTVCIGKPDDKMLAVYNIVKSAQLAALDEIKTGVEGLVVDTAARDIIRGAGYGENFGHGLGHSVGLEIHEEPSFPRSEPEEEKQRRLEHEEKAKIENPEKYKEAQEKKEKNKFILAENIVITVEPGIYIENEFGVRIEDLVVVKKGGCSNLTKSSKNLIEL
ncbi:MAG: aminopeptidase P family protein [Oscillospiraceae bacterium]|nr:aminopeptidase P family protein [Oscillospiraceae bacterium]